MISKEYALRLSLDSGVSSRHGQSIPSLKASVSVGGLTGLGSKSMLNLKETLSGA